MTLRAGTHLGAYEILSPLGAGGMGEVYRARDAKLEREVAVKVLPASVANDPDALSRFEREAKAVAALSHPNILSIFDFGQHGGVAYAVTELLEGETLREKLEGGPVSQKQSVDYGLQIAKGLSAAHERGIVHRDLKPENVFVTKHGHVKILDFGLAKRVESGTPGEMTNVPTVEGQTEPGKVMGTVGYMSPEQARGLPVDHRSDIFSLGAILYELFSGRRAFKKDTPGDTLAAIIRDEPADLTESGRNISPALDHIVRHCLDKDPGNRFQSAKDIAFALSEASGPTTVTSGVQAVPAPPPGKRRTLVTATVVVVVLAGLGIFLMRRTQGRPAAAGVKRVAVLPFENLGAPEDDYFSDGIADAVRGKLTSVPGLEVIARGSSTPYKKTTKPAQEIARELGAHYLLTATVRWQKGGVANRVQVSPELVEIRESGAPASRWQQPFDAAVTDVFQVQSDIASRVAQALGVALAEGQKKQLSEKPTQNLAAYDAFLKGEEVSGALSRNDPPSIRKSLDLYERAVALDPGFAIAWARIGAANSLRYNNTTPTRDVAERAREAAEKAMALAPDLAESYRALGTYYRVVTRDYPRALEAFTKGRSRFPADPDLLRGVATVETSLGRWDEALEHSRQAERLDPRNVSNIRNLGGILSRLRRWSEAREAFDRALALSPDNVVLVEEKAMTFLGEGNLSRARAFLRDAQERVEPSTLVSTVANFYDLAWVLDSEQVALLRRLTPASFDDDEALWAYCQAQACALAGDAAGVRDHADRAATRFEVQLKAAPDNVNLATGHAVALAYAGKKAEAIREAERISALRPIAQDARDGPYVRHQLARVYILTGEHEKALDVLESLLKIPYFLSPGWLKIDPTFDPLRDQPRFQKLVAGIK